MKRLYFILFLSVSISGAAQENILSYEELMRKDTSLQGEITNHFYLSVNEFYYSHFRFPTEIDELFDYMFHNLSIYAYGQSFPTNIQHILSINKSSFSLLQIADSLSIRYDNKVFGTFQRPYDCDGCCTLHYADFVRNGFIQYDCLTEKIEEKFYHKIWHVFNKCTKHNNGTRLFYHTESEDSVLIYSGMVYSFQDNTLTVHDICRFSFSQNFSLRYYALLKKKVFRFCKKYDYDEIRFTTPFVNEK